MNRRRFKYTIEIYMLKIMIKTNRRVRFAHYIFGKNFTCYTVIAIDFDHVSFSQGQLRG